MQYDNWQVSTPDATSPCNKVKIETFTISEEEASRANIGANSYTRIKQGTYKRLMINNGVMMSNTNFEIKTNYEFVSNAKGNILINGLGLGMILEKILEKDEVKQVTVIEFDERVINLVGPTFKNDSRVTIIHANAFEYKPPKGSYFDFVWHDIWEFITADNLSEMTKLHRKYGKRSGWQGSWAKEFCKLARKGYMI